MANIRKSCYFAGYVGETKARLIALPIDDLIEEWPSTVPMLIGKRPGEQDTYLCDTVLHDNELIWTVRLYDTQFKGSGSIQIVMVDQSEKIVGKSEAMMTKVSPALTGKNDGQYDKEPEEITDPYLQRLAEYVTQINTSIVELQRINITAEGYIQRIETLASDAEKSAKNAGVSERNAFSYQQTTASHAAAAQNSADSARGSAAAARSDAQSASASATNSATFMQASLSAMEDAKQYRDEAQAIAEQIGDISADAAEAKANAKKAEDAAKAAKSSENLAANYASTATSSARTAQTHATNASTYAVNASVSASNAAASANRAKDTLTDLENKIASGEFKGEPGEPGEPGTPGEPGKSPVVGVDYFTDTDKTAIVNQVKDAVQPSVSQLNNQIVNLTSLLEAVRDALKNGDIDEAINLLDTFILDEGVLD